VNLRRANVEVVPIALLADIEQGARVVRPLYPRPVASVLAHRQPRSQPANSHMLDGYDMLGITCACCQKSSQLVASSGAGLPDEGQMPGLMATAPS